MTTPRQQKCILTYMVLATVALLVLGPGWATAAYDRDTNQQQYQSQQQYQDQDQGDQSYQPPSRAMQTQGRDMRLEQQIASRLRQQGYGAQGEIMILATGNRVILLGTVPDNRTKDGAEKAAKQIATRQSVDNRLHVNAQAKRTSDADLEKKTYDKLGDDLSQNVQVRAQNGTVTLQGQLDNWRQVADAIDAAFTAGASQVNSQFSVAGAGAMARGGAGGGAYPSYGYAPGQQGQYGGQQGFQGQQGYQGAQGSMGGMNRASSSDLTLARQVASQLRQQLPPGQNVQPIQPQSIYVTAQRGTVTLHGYVQSSNQKQQAQQIVQSIQGVQNVQNDLTILSTRGGAGQAGGQGSFSRQGGQGYGAQGSSQGFGGQGGQSYGNQGYGSSNQGFGGTSSQNRSYQPQGYISPTPGNQSQQGMSSQDQSGQSSGQQDFGGATDQSQSDQSSQSSSQQGFGSAADQSQSGQSSQSGSQQGFGSAMDQSQSGQSSQMGGRQARGAVSPADMALAQQVVQQLKQKLPSIQNIQVMRPGTIYVMATQGTVMLHGFVQNNNISQQANQIARAIPGVRDIQSTLRAGAAAGGQAFGYVPGQEQKDQQGAAGQDMTGQNQGMQGRNQGATGENQSAQGSAQMRQIAAPGQMGANQSSRQGAANQGMYGQNRSASGQGQGTAGRMGTAPSSQSDQALAQQVAQKLRQQLTGIQNVQVARPGTIYVIVSNGTVTLDGLVSSNSQKQKAEQVAKSISGVQNVKNSLSVNAGAAGGQAYGYMPPGQDQGASAQFMEDQYGNQQPGNQYGNQSSGNQGNQQSGNRGNQQFGNQGNQPSGNQSGGQLFLFIPPDEDQSEAQFGNQMGNQQSDEDQAGNEQPDEGTY